jgi:uncharacterized protein
MSNQISWFEIIGGDAARLHGFYADLFGWKLQANNAMQYGLVSDAEAGIGGGIGPDPEGGPGYVTVYVGVDDINAALEKAQQLGAKVVMPPTAIAELNVTVALFSDPAGHVIGLTQN